MSDGNDLLIFPHYCWVDLELAIAGPKTHHPNQPRYLLGSRCNYHFNLLLYVFQNADMLPYRGSLRRTIGQCEALLSRLRGERGRKMHLWVPFNNSTPICFVTQIWVDSTPTQYYHNFVSPYCITLHLSSALGTGYFMVSFSQIDRCPASRFV